MEKQNVDTNQTPFENEIKRTTKQKSKNYSIIGVLPYISPSFTKQCRSTYTAASSILLWEYPCQEPPYFQQVLKIFVILEHHEIT